MSKRGRDYLFFLEDILTAIAKIEHYTKDIDYEEFCNHDMAIDAVIRNLEVIGEAVRNIPEDIKNRYPKVEWKEAKGFRNVLIHDYFGIDIEMVWDTIKKNIPVFKADIVEVLKLEREQATKILER